MCKRLRVNAAPGHRLDPVVSDRYGGSQSFLNVTPLKESTLVGRIHHTPARQSACSSVRTESSLRSFGRCCCARRTSSLVPCSVWMW